MQETLADMARSVFCATPPGQTQDSVRVFRAIIKGCIPVTMYRGNDRPFERHLLVPWDTFSVNLQPDDHDQMNRVLQVCSQASHVRVWCCLKRNAMWRHARFHKVFLFQPLGVDSLCHSVQLKLV